MNVETIKAVKVRFSDEERKQLREVVTTELDRLSRCADWLKMDKTVVAISITSVLTCEIERMILVLKD